MLLLSESTRKINLILTSKWWKFEVQVPQNGTIVQYFLLCCGGTCFYDLMLNLVLRWTLRKTIRAKCETFLPPSFFSFQFWLISITSSPRFTNGPDHLLQTKRRRTKLAIGRSTWITLFLFCVLLHHVYFPDDFVFLVCITITLIMGTRWMALLSDCPHTAAH